MDQKIVKTISAQIYRLFPEVTGNKPKVRRQPVPKNKSGVESPQCTYLLTFHSKTKAQGGRTINRYVRVVADGKGKILKFTTSR